MKELKRTSKEEYNSIPVYYCTSCLSLRIRGEIDGFEYCDECGSTSIELCSIEEWENKYRERTGHSYLENFK